MRIRLSSQILLVVLVLGVLVGFYSFRLWERHSDVVEDDGLADDFRSIYGLDAMGVVSFTDENEDEHYYIYKDDIETYLVIGTDASGKQDLSDGGEYRGKMADFLALMVFDKTRKTFAILQLNRDTITAIPLIDAEGNGEATRQLQLCTAHWFGSDQEMSAQNTVRAVSEMLGELSIKGYFEMDMSNISEMNRLLRGVTVTLEDNNLKDIYPEFVEGETVSLTDEQAEVFVRARTGLVDDSNENRMQRQRLYLSAAIQKANMLFRSDSNYANDLYKELQDMVFTDVYGNYASRFANYVQMYENRGIISFEGESKVGYVLDDGLPHSEFYVTQDTILQTMMELYGLEEVD